MKYVVRCVWINRGYFRKMTDNNIKTKHGIYKISFIGSDKFYIGSAIDLSKRHRNHLSDLRKERHPNIIMQRLFNKYGEKNVVFEVLEYVLNKEDLINREQFYLDTLCPTINILKKANSGLGNKHTEESLEKLRIIARERAKDPNWIAKVKGTWFKEGKMVLTEKQLQRYKEWGSISFKGKKHTEESKQLMREKAKKRVNYNKKNLIVAPLKKKIIVIKNGEKTEFKCIADFERFIGMNGTNGSLRRNLLKKGSHYLSKYNILISYA